VIKLGLAGFDLKIVEARVFMRLGHKAVTLLVTGVPRLLISDHHCCSLTNLALL